MSQGKRHKVWLAAHCWVCVGVEKAWTFSQDIASLPSLSGSQEESSVPFNFSFFLLFVLRLLRPHSLSLACNSCYSSCTVCATRSWKDRKTNLENYFTYVIGDYRTAVCGIGSHMPRPMGTGVGLSNAVPRGRLTASLLIQWLVSAAVREPIRVGAAMSALFLWWNKRKLHQAVRSAQKPLQLSNEYFYRSSQNTHLGETLTGSMTERLH